MEKHYIVEVKYEERSSFLLWHVDGFILSDNKLLVFKSLEEARAYADKENILVDDRVDSFDYSMTAGLIAGIEDKDKCGLILNLWNLLSDLSQATGIPFEGDRDDVLSLYEKLVFGSDLPMLKSNTSGEFSNEDKKRIKHVIAGGIYSFRDAIYPD